MDCGGRKEKAGREGGGALFRRGGRGGTFKLAASWRKRKEEEVNCSPSLSPLRDLGQRTGLLIAGAHADVVRVDDAPLHWDGRSVSLTCRVLSLAGGSGKEG